MLTDYITLDRPLVSLDLETTGTDAKKDRIVSIGLVKVYTTGIMTEWETLINPGVPIPRETSDVHGITDAIVNACVICQRQKSEHLDNEDPSVCAKGYTPWPTFKNIAPILAAGLADCDLLGYNLGHFDVPLLKEEFTRANVTWTPGRIVDGFRIFQRMSPRNLIAAVREYIGEELVGAHGALNDARAALRVVEAQLGRHRDELPRTVQELHDMFFVLPSRPDTLDPDGKLRWINGEACIAFGKKHPGKTLREVKALDPGFLRNFILNGEFNDVVKKIAREALEGRFPVKP